MCPQKGRLPMKHTRNQLFLWMTAVLILSASLLACKSPKSVPCLPEKYLDWTVAEASVTMTDSEIVKSNIVVTLEGKSIRLDFENGELKESEAISQKSSQLSGGEFLQFLEESSDSFKEITQSDTVLISVSGNVDQLETLTAEEVYLYDASTGNVTKTSYDGAGGIAWGSIMDGGYVQVYTLILR